MKIVVAGFNVDQEALRNVQVAGEQKEVLTPETISAAYARISRDPRPVDELRRDARRELPKARASNKNIVFDMGHSSIAEHALFNLDIIGVSRLLVEEIEKFRLVSYTEKSQRYVLLSDDFVLPEEIQTQGLSDTFIRTIRRQNHLYQELYEKLRDHLFERHATEATRPQGRLLLEGRAKEDARYTLSLATETQLGMTINCRNLELMLRRLSALPWAEARQYARRLYEVTYPIAPSLIRYSLPTDYDRLTRSELTNFCNSIPSAGERPPSDGGPQREVELLWSTPDADLKILASIYHSASKLPFSACLDGVKRLDHQGRQALLLTACRHLQSYDPVLREFEYGELAFEITLSAACFAQLKRHRMATITTQGYDPALGRTIPPAIYEIGGEKRFQEVMTETEATYWEIMKKAPAAAPYILTNAHRRRIMIKMNARELYHLARLRADAHAQWDIRERVQKMLDLAKEAMPLTLLFACGKDSFPALYKRLYDETR